MHHANDSEDAICPAGEKTLREDKKTVPPTWLSRDLIENCLKKSKHYNEYTLVSFGVDYGCNSFYTFGSSLFRLSLTLKDQNNSEKNLSLITKCIPDDTKKEFLPGLIEGFKKEILVFSKIVNGVNSLLESIGFPDSVAAEWYGAGKTPTYFLFIENLLASSYQMANKREVLDLNHSLLVMNLIAKYHAATAVILQKNNVLIEDFKGCTRFVRGNDRGLRQIFAHIAPIIVDTLTKRSNIPPCLIARVQYLADSLPDKIEEITQYKPNRFNVLLHGDLWINNLMFRYLNGVVTGVKLIDFQESFISSPAYDLLFYIHCSLKEEVELNNFQLLIDEYYKTLCETLSVLQYDGLPYSMENLRNDIDEFEDVHLFATVFVTGVTLASEDIAASFEGTSRGHLEFFKSVYTNPTYISRLERKLLLLAEKEVF